ncbi:hypothetical protein [Dyadobacter jiangsuensis]|uniref:Uncharacterized protein n=1 Tax=Dyadobacter jiangsuensis TaxID=1591085 RepID=A0A2P8F7E1_9BACT|nr:hypothetical protein [Dyadobacter jiangsuensis]PSL17645.1 hypothetical protein CLV60_1364 [Dyadobacter jiangsuensis]
MKYLIIDASLTGTGIRDQYNGGFIEVTDLQLSTNLINLIKSWLARYGVEHYNGFIDDSIIDNLDSEGKAIAKKVKDELVDAKVEYFSDARLTRTIIT